MAKTDLKLTKIKQIAKQNNTQETYEFEDGSTLNFYPTFPPSLIDEMFEEMQLIFQTKPEELELSEKLTHSYILYMCCKHFTHLKSQFKAKDIVGQLDELRSLIDSGYYEKIIEDVFSPIEIQKVFNQLAKFGSNYIFLEKMTQKMQDEVGKLELQNKHIFENLSTPKTENKVVQ